MAIAIGRFGRLKRWIKGQIVKGCIGMKNKTIKAIRGGPRPEENEIALEVNPEMDLFQVVTLVSGHRICPTECIYNIMNHIYIVLNAKNSILGRKWRFEK